MDSNTKPNSLSKSLNMSAFYHNEFGIRLIAAAAMGNVPALNQLLLINPYVNPKDNHGDTPLMVAAHAGHIHAVNFLLSQNGIQVDLINSKRETALMLAAQNGHFNIVKVILAAGAEIGLQDTDKKTALDHAAENGHTKIAMYLQCIHSNYLKQIFEQRVLPLTYSLALARSLSETFSPFTETPSMAGQKVKIGY